MDSTDLIADTASRIFRDHCDPRRLAAESGGAWQAPAWRALEAAGLPLAWVPEELGGAGAGLAAGFAVTAVAGRYALALPLAETLLAGWLLSQAGIAAPSGAMTCAPTRRGETAKLAGNGTLSGRLRWVPFAASAEHLALVAEQENGSGHAVALVELGKVPIAAGSSIAGDALNTLSLEGVRPVAVKPAARGCNPEALLRMGAVVRALQMSGALEAILEIAVSYANERIAFARPIAKFQAVQHNLARLAGETAAAVAAAASAADSLANAGTPAAGARKIDPEDAVLLEVAAAKIRVGEAAGVGAGIAHQVLGAIGFTREHVLHRFTQRLWAWRDDFDNESAWAVRLGTMIAAHGGDALWPLLASR